MRIDVERRPITVWLDELPDARYEAEQWLEARTRTGFSRGRRRSVAVEWRSGRTGHPSSYGLLGLEFVPIEQTEDPIHAEQVIHVAVSPQETGEPLSWSSLPEIVDTAYRGLPAQYARPVLRIVSRRAWSLGNGTLTIDCAAHGYVGSSEAIFTMLAEALLHLLTVEPAQATPEYLHGLFDGLLAAWITLYGRDRDDAPGQGQPESAV